MTNLNVVEQIIASEGYITVEQYREHRTFYFQPDPPTEEWVNREINRLVSELEDAEADGEWDKAESIRFDLRVLSYLQKEFEYGIIR